MQESLHSDLIPLWDEVDRLWEASRLRPAFEGYVSADYPAVLATLERWRDESLVFLEWGSGLGVVTIMASLLGLESYGIETEQELVDYSRQFAEKYSPEARFACGSFIPDSFVWDPASGDDPQITVIDEPAAYDQLGLNLDEFDLIYAYPWPTEHQLLRNVLKQFGRPDTLLLTYDAHEGVQLSRVQDW